MKEAYISIFSNTVNTDKEEALRNILNNVDIEFKGNKYLIYKHSQIPKGLSTIEDFKNTFLIIKKFDQLTGNYFKPIFQWAGRHNFEDILPTLKSLGYKSFRLILNEDFKIISGHRRAVKALERQIAKQTGVRVDRVSPSTEIWILHTKDDYGFVMLKITNAKQSAKV